MNATIPSYKIWFDGAIMDPTDVHIPLLTHSLFYGSAVFEGIRCYSSLKGPVIFCLEDHIHHLFHSAEVMGMVSKYSKQDIVNAVTNLIKENNLNECYIRPIFFYGEKMDLLPIGTPVHVAIANWKWGKYLPRETVTVKITPYIRMNSHSTSMTAKISGNYANSILALLDARKSNFDKALFLDEKGYFAEGAGENIFFVKDKSIITPTTNAIIPGITRASIICIATDLGYEVIERNISPDETSTFTEAFFTGTASEVNAISKIDEHIFNNSEEGSTVKKIKAAYQRAVHGEDERYSAWLHYIATT